MSVPSNSSQPRQQVLLVRVNQVNCSLIYVCKCTQIMHSIHNTEQKGGRWRGKEVGIEKLLTESRRRRKIIKHNLYKEEEK